MKLIATDKKKERGKSSCLSRLATRVLIILQIERLCINTGPTKATESSIYRCLVSLNKFSRDCLYLFQQESVIRRQRMIV